jgi:hypothetical protein
MKGPGLDAEKPLRGSDSSIGGLYKENGQDCDLSILVAFIRTNLSGTRAAPTSPEGLVPAGIVPQERAPLRVPAYPRTRRSRCCSCRGPRKFARSRVPVSAAAAATRRGGRSPQPPVDEEDRSDPCDRRDGTGALRTALPTSAAAAVAAAAVAAAAAPVDEEEGGGAWVAPDVRCLPSALGGAPRPG